MEFNIKLQELRKRKSLTQEQLADCLFVSRTAISKWESGRGYPNIESLKAISKFFGVTIDELLSGDELLEISQKDSKEKVSRLHDLVFGLLDICVSALIFLPFFGQNTDGIVQSVSISALTDIGLYLKISYYIVVSAITIFGVLTLVLQNCEKVFWVRNNRKASLLLTIAAIILFVISQQPYAAVYLMIFMIIKIFMLIKWQ